MLRPVMMMVGVVCTLGVIAASMGMNFLFGYGFGTTVETARVWGGLSVASDGLKAVLPIVIAHQLAARHWGRAVMGSAIFPLVLAYGFMSALGFAAQSRGVLVAGRENVSAALTQAKADAVVAEAKRTKLGDQRLPGVIEADMAGLKREPMWETTRECEEGRTNAARVFCRKLDALSAELLVAREAEALSARIAALHEEIKGARERGANQVADFQAEVLVWVFGEDRRRIGAGLSWLAALLVEGISAFGLLALDQARRKQKAEGEREAPWKLVGEAVEVEA